jgi:outer membrane protein OmpA-like peptidoglycan-associated protein
MTARYLAILSILLTGCASSVDVQPMLNEFDDTAKDVRAVVTDEHAQKMLESADAKRAEAGALVDQGKKKEAIPVIEQALADARLALDIDEAMAAAKRADKCRLEVEQARTKYSEAVYLLQQTEEFVGQDVDLETEEPTAETGPALPASTLTTESFPPASMSDVDAQWQGWRAAANERKVAVGDIESAYKKAVAATQAEKVEVATTENSRYLAGRAVQSLEARVREAENERVCAEATDQMARYGDARAEALQATIELERGLKANLRSELDQARKEAKDRQDELYKSLQQLEGKFASVRRDARGTIVSLADILFDFDKATLRRDVELNLVKIATILNQYPEMKVQIEGHTDAVGTDEYNLGLSQRRAQAVYEFMIAQGDVAQARLNHEGYGESRPVADNDTEEGRQKNRRVDLVILDAAKTETAKP